MVYHWEEESEKFKTSTWFLVLRRELLEDSDKALGLESSVSSNTDPRAVDPDPHLTLGEYTTAVLAVAAITATTKTKALKP